MLTLKFKVLILLVLSFVVFLLYLPGINGAFYYDDIRPLSALTKVTDLQSALIYIFSETSGPLGRPIAMVSFLFNMGDWPTASSAGNPQRFFLFNVVLHCINGLLVFVFSYLLILLYKAKHKGKREHAFWLAFAAAAFWLILPILVSTSLIAIQRMAGLSAFFVLAGLCIYLLGLYKQSAQVKQTNAGAFLQLTGLIFFTLLAMFTKENGILLPIFVLVLELTLLANNASISYRRKLRVYSCGLGLLVIMGYLFFSLFTYYNVFTGREYTVIERLFTQPQILVDYLRLAFFPDINSFSPFHDNYKHVESPLSSVKTFLSICFILIMFVIALVLRKKYTLFSFAVLWFLASHLLESSVINLELYFEHRNYVALIGPCLAIVLSFNTIASKYKKMAVMSFAVYWLMLAINLFLTTSLWGDKQQAAEAWFIEKPNSARATEFLSDLYLKDGKINTAKNLLSMHIANCKDCVNSQARLLFFSCYADDKLLTIKTYDELLRLSTVTINARGVAGNLAQVHKLISNNDCQHISLSALKKLNTAFLNAPESPFNKKFSFLQNLYVFALDNKDIDEAIRILYLAWAEQQDDVIANELVSMLVANNKHLQAEDFVKESVCKRTALNPIIHNEKLEQCKQLSLYIQNITEKVIK
ncbi:tetratricopeptide repeat protein [Thalassotalea piscium]